MTVMIQLQFPVPQYLRTGLSNRRADVTVDQIWSFYNQQLTAQGWTVKSGAPGTGQPVTSGYRIEIWYK